MLAKPLKRSMQNMVHQISFKGSEVEGKVKPLCKALKIKLINSRPYHPQSQGKVERSHRQLRKKDYVRLGNSGEEES